jgi:GntR family transcriptional regulator
MALTPDRTAAKRSARAERAEPAKLVRSAGTLLHRQLFMVLREQIVRGVYPPGAGLPNEDELCAHFGVSRITVRRALTDLKQMGLIERFQGRGTFVSAQLAATHPFEAVSFVDALKKAGRETQVKVLAVRTAAPPVTVALQLQIRSGEQAVNAARLRHNGPTPLMVTEAWVPLELGRRVTSAQLRKRPLYDILLSQGIEFGRVIEEITAVTADPNLASLLGTEVGMPLLRVTRLVYDRGNRPVEHLTVHMSPQRSRILLNVPTDDAQTSVASRIVHDLTPA